MKKRKLISLIIIIFIALGFLIGSIIPEKITFCTEQLCRCGVENLEVPCNGCELTNTIFFTGIINIYKICRVTQTLMCEDGKNVGVRFDVGEGDCIYYPGVLFDRVWFN